MHPVTKISIFGVRLGVIALIVYWIVIFLGTHLPKPPNIAASLGDKSKHTIAYFGLGLLLCYVTNHPRTWQRFLSVAAIALTYGAIDELTQQLVPGRHADVMDWVADAVGVTLAIAVYSVARHWYRKRQRGL
ncbi:MAG: VanZ family protein [Pirellulaceae bacterium]|nr:VanZ family protein [Pirellulaceae bacterium]